jgi:tetratricopeptide (TPR) repeat protein
MADLSLLEGLDRLRPGQSLEEALVASAVEHAEPVEAEALQAAAIPLAFDAEMLGALLGSPEQAPVLVPRLVANHSFINPSNGHFAYHEVARRAILANLRRDSAARFRQLNVAAARFYESKAAAALPGVARDGFQRNAMYHLLAAGGEEEARGYSLLRELFDQAEQGYQVDVAYLLLQLTQEHYNDLARDHQLGVQWLQGRLARLLKLRSQKDRFEALRQFLLPLMAAPGGVAQSPDDAARLTAGSAFGVDIAILRAVLIANPPAALRPQVELSLAMALADDEEWAEAIELGKAAALAFHVARLPYDEARAQIEIARAYAGLARAARGARVVRPALESVFVNALYQAVAFMERLPILIYLLIWLGPRIVFTAPTQVARDQDWVVARLFVTAARHLRNAERRLMRPGTAAAEPAQQALWVEARRALAALYRTLGHAGYATELLEDLLGHPLVLQNTYLVACLRLDLAGALHESGHAPLAVEELYAALPALEAARDDGNRARALHLKGLAIWSAEQDGHASGSEWLLSAVQSLGQSLDLYDQLGNRAARAEVARVLDQIADDARLPGDSLARVAARSAAESVPERRFPVRFAHPSIIRFQKVALIGLVIAFFAILFLSVRTGAGTEVSAAALIHSGPLAADSTDFKPAVSVDLPVQQLRPRFLGGFAVTTALAVLATYLLLYVLAGLGLISVTSAQALRAYQPHVLVLGSDGIQYQDSGGAVERSIAWKDVREAVRANRCIYRRPVANYSHLVLFGNDTAIDIPARAANYEGELTARIAAALPVPARAIGFSAMRDWSGWLFLTTLFMHIVFLVASALNTDLALGNVIGPYALNDLYPVIFLGYLAPLAWWFVINPLREVIVLRPRDRLPWGFGLIGLGLEAVVLVAAPAVSPVLPRPDIYPVLVGVSLILAAAVTILSARRWEGSPSMRRAPAYPAWVRLGVAAIAVLAIAAALIHLTTELRAYQALVQGNEMRDALATDTGKENARAGALAYYTEAISLTPHNPVAYASRGAIYAERGDFASAITDYDVAIELRPDQPIAYANRAVAYQSWAHVLQPQPDHQLVNPVIATMTVEVKDDLERAVSDYRRAQALAPVNAAYDVELGTALHELGRYEDAVVEYQRALSKNPDEANAYAGIGWARFTLALSLASDAKAERQAEATANYLTAQPNFDQAGAILKAQAGRLPVDTPARAALDRRRANVLNGAAWVAVKLRQFNAALSNFNAASQLDPSNGEYHVSLGNVYWLASQGEQNKAKYRILIASGLSEYEKAIPLIARTVEQAFLYRTLGQFHYILYTQPLSTSARLASLRNAIAADDRAIELDPTQASYYRYRGAFHYLMPGLLSARDKVTAELHYQLAISDLRQALQILPIYMDARNILVNVYRDLSRRERAAGNFGGAVQYNRAAVDLNDADITSRNLLAWSLHLAGQDGEAITETLRVIELDPNDVLARFNLSVLRLYVGDVDQARRDYQEALKRVGRLDQNTRNSRYLDAIDDLNTFKRLHPEQARAADEMLSMIFVSRQ